MNGTLPRLTSERKRKTSNCPGARLAFPAALPMFATCGVPLRWNHSAACTPNCGPMPACSIASRRSGTERNPSVNLRGLLQNRDLPSVIKLVLRDAVKHMKEVVSLARNAVPQAGFRESCNGLDQLFMNSLGRGDGLAPRGFCRFCRNTRKIMQTGRLPFLPCKPHHPGIIPDCDVQKQLPDAVNVSDRT